jgi:1-phosphofructokinase
MHATPDGAGPRGPKVCVFAPAPLLTVTIESSRHGDADDAAEPLDDEGELHLHVGGQGYWVARMLRTLGIDVVLCATFGGETGAVAR